MHRGPVIAAAIVRGTPYTSGVDGRVLRWTKDLHLDAVVHEDEANPVHALAAYDGALIGLSTLGLLDWSNGAPITSGLPSLDHLVVRGKRAFALSEAAVVVLEKKENAWTVTKEISRDAGPAIDFDVDPSAKFAVVVRHPNLVETLDLAKGTRLGAWSRKEKVVFRARFGAKPDTLLVTDGRYNVVHLKAKSGRPSPGGAFLVALVGAIVTDDRNCAVCTDGEDVAILTKEAAELLHIVLDAHPSDEKLAASLGRIPRFREVLPGFFKRTGSSPAPELEIRQTALAIDGAVIAGYINGDVVRIEPDSGRVDSAERGCIAPARSVNVIELSRESAFAVVDDELWIVSPDRIRIVDLDRRTVRDGPALEGFSGLLLPHPWNLEITDDAILCATRDEASVFRRSDGKLLGRQPVPKNRGAIPFEGAVAFIAKDRVTPESFVVERLDVFTGARSDLWSYRREPPKTAAGDPTDWVHLGRFGKQIVIHGISDGTCVFDPSTGATGPRVPRAVIDEEYSYRFKTGAPLVAVADHGEMIVHDLEKPGFAILAQFPLDGNLERAKPATFSRASGRSAAATPRSRIVVWERDGTRVTELLGHRDPTELWLSPNGRTLAVFDWEAKSMLRLWALD